MAFKESANKPSGKTDFVMFGWTLNWTFFFFKNIHTFISIELIFKKSKSFTRLLVGVK